VRGDGVLSLAGAALAAVTLASLAFDAAFGWWWSDAVAALLMAAFLLPEGWLTASLTRHGQMPDEQPHQGRLTNRQQRRRPGKLLLPGRQPDSTYKRNP
jgi:fatty acid desaturase